MKFSRSSAPVYVPLDDTDDALRHPKTPYAKTLIAIVLSLLASIIIFALGRRSAYDFNSHYAIQLPTTIRTMEWANEFATRPSNESEIAWQSMYPRGGTFFSHAPEVPTRSTLSVFHQLHCLDAIRQAYYQAYDAAIASQWLKAETIPEMTSEAHVMHCIELLRQSLMCASDRTVEVKNSLGGVTGFGTAHKCADYGVLVRKIEVWKMESGDDMEYQSGSAHHSHPHVT